MKTNYFGFFCVLFFATISMHSVQAQNLIVAETEVNNNTTATAMLLTLPAKVRGNIFPLTDVDFYSFTATAGSKV